MDYSYAKSRQDRYKVGHQGSSTDPFDAARKGIGATQADDNDFGFDWLKGGYDLQASGREEYTMSAREVKNGQNVSDVTRRDDYGNPRRNNLGASRHVDLGATGGTRREDIGVSAAEVLRASDGNPLRQSTPDVPYYRGLRDTGKYGTNRSDIPEREEVSNPRVEPYDYARNEADYSASDRLENADQKPRRWTSVAADRDLMQEWHEMFGQIRTKWAPISGLDDPTTDHKPTGDSISSENSGILRKDGGRRRRILTLAILVAVMVMVVTVAVIVPIVVLTLSEDEEKEEVVIQYEYKAKITNVDYTAEMADSNSDDFLDVENDFCNQLDQTAASKNITDFTYVGCFLQEIQNGSLIILYSAFIKTRSRGQALPTAGKVSIFLGIAVAADDQQSVGAFIIVNVEVTVIIPKVVKEKESAVKRRVEFNGACLRRKDRCITKRSRCKDNICQCRENRIYDEPSDFCTKIDCGDVPDIGNGTVTNSGTKYGSTLSITCNEGFELSSDTTISCTTPGSWGTLPSCMPVECPIFIRPNNSEVDSNTIGRTYTDVIEITCISGYEFDGNLSMVTCLANQSWSEHPACTPIDCMQLNVPVNAVIFPDRSQYVYKENATIECDSGFQLQGASIISCEANGTWKDLPNCVPIDCELLNVPENAGFLPDKDQFVYGEKVNIECDTGYQLQGNEMISCQDDGKWINIPECTPINCETFPMLDNAAISPEKQQYVYDDIITVACDTGYEIQGEQNVSCEPNGTWKDLPNCVPIDCELLNVPENAGIVPDKNQFVYREKVNIECDTGYLLQGNEMISCQENGKWINIPECIPVNCETFPMLDNAAISPEKQQYLYSDIITVACDNGYEVQGNETVSCKPNGSWKDLPKCVPVECDPIDVPDNAEFTGGKRQFVYSEAVTIKCNTGYEIQGNETITCESDGTWKEIPTCSLVKCERFEISNKGVISPDKQQYAYNETVTVECKGGYEIPGESTVRCLDDQSWTDIPTCEPISCVTLEIPEHAEIDTERSELSYDDTVSVSCKSGFELASESNISCKADGTWPVIYCVPVNCSIKNMTPPENSIATNVNKSTPAFDVECVEGYDIVGNSSVTCIAGSWSEFPSCEITDCGPYELTSKTYELESSSTTTYNSSLSVTCVDGLELTDDSVIAVSCGADGKWHGKVECKLPVNLEGEGRLFKIVAKENNEFWHFDGNFPDVQAVSSRYQPDDAFVNFMFELEMDGSYKIKSVAVPDFVYYMYDGFNVSGSPAQYLHGNDTADDDHMRYLVTMEMPGYYRIQTLALSRYVRLDEDKFVSSRSNIKDDRSLFKLECVAPDDQTSTSQACPRTYFESKNITGIVGESVVITCYVEYTDGLSDIIITKGADRDIVASYLGGSYPNSVTVLSDESMMNDSFGVLMINKTLQSGDDGEFFCTANSWWYPSEAVTVLSVESNLEGRKFKIFAIENNRFWHFDGNNANVKAVSSIHQVDDDFVKFMFEKEVDGSYKIKSVAKPDYYMYDGFNVSGSPAQYLHGNDTAYDDNMRYLVFMETQGNYRIQTKATDRYVRLDTNQYVSSIENIMDNRSLFRFEEEEDYEEYEY